MADLSQLKVLIFEPSEEKAEQLQGLLQGVGVCAIHLQTQYRPICEVIDAVEPGLIFVGDTFPECTIRETLDQVKKHRQHSRVPKMIYTDIKDPAALRSLVSEGVSGVVEFPPTAGGVKRALRSYFRYEKSREVAQLLRSCWFFEDFTPTELRTLIKATYPRRFQAGETILETDDPADTFYVLLKGSVEAVVSEKGRQAFAVTIEEGNPFGEMALFDNSFRGACCIAADEALVLEIGAPVLLDNDFKPKLKIFAKLTEVLAKRLQGMNQLLRQKQVEVRNVVQEPAAAEISADAPVEMAPSYDEGPDVADLSNMDLGEDDLGGPEEAVDKTKNPFSAPTATAETIDGGIKTQEEYDVFSRKVKLRTDFILQKIPKQVYEIIHNKLYGYWTSGKLAKFNPHVTWNPKLFSQGSCRLKNSLHIVAVCGWGKDAYEDCYLGLPFSHRCIGLSDSGCTGTFLFNRNSVERYIEEIEVKKAIQLDLEMPIDRIWRGVECVEFLTHTAKDVRPTTLFVIFDGREGKFTKMIRNAFPDHQIVTIVTGHGYDPEDMATLFTHPETQLAQAGLLNPKSNYDGLGFYQGQTFFLPDLSMYYKNTDRLDKNGYIFGTLGMLALMGPDYSGITWGSKGGAEGAVKAARAMYGTRGAQSAKDLANAINWADE